MTFGSFFVISALIAIVCVVLLVLLDVDDFRTFTIGEYILLCISCFVPFFNWIWIFFGGGMVVFELFSRLIFERKWFKNIVNRKPFVK
jgi:hypothetical protein